jgi:hypothetical protein
VTRALAEARAAAKLVDALAAKDGAKEAKAAAAAVAAAVAAMARAATALGAH